MVFNATFNNISVISWRKRKLLDIIYFIFNRKLYFYVNCVNLIISCLNDNDI